MKIKAIVSDFDGTIVSYDQQISAAVESAIADYVAHGGVFSIATGRAYEGLLQNMCHRINLKTPQIVRGGAEIISAQTDEVIWGKYIPRDSVLSILNKLIPLKQFVILAESGKDLFTRNGESNPEFATGANISDIANLNPERVPKIAIPPLHELEQITLIMNDLKTEFSDLHIVKTTSKNGFGVDINSGEAGKQAALLAYAEIMNLNPQEIMGVGDSFNDLPLLSACGLKVAMGNAPTELKEVADFIVGNQSEDGVVEAIKLATKS